jgi:hypothetical protein
MTRVRILKPFYWKARDAYLKSGDMASVPDEDAQLWLRHGMAMEDKTVDVPENRSKPTPPVEAKPVEIKPIEVKPKPRKKAKK